MLLRIGGALIGVVLLAGVLVDAFVTVVAARRATQTFRITRLFYRVTWASYAALVRRVRSGRRREAYLSAYGPLFLLLLLAWWAATLVAAFALLQWSIGLRVHGAPAGFWTDLYASATTFFTMGLVEPSNLAARILMIVELALGYSFLGLIIGYPPVLYGFFSRREARTSMLDARAGSPPTATQLLVRQGRNPERLETQLADWEGWAADVLQSHLSYPMLAYFRSQHTNESWLGTLTTVLDASALVITCGDADLKRQAELTLAMCRHALVDLAAVFATKPRQERAGRLAPGQLEDVCAALGARPIALKLDRLAYQDLDRLVQVYEPYAHALAVYFLIALPPWYQKDGERKRDNWESTTWDSSSVPFAVSDPFSTTS